MSLIKNLFGNKANTTTTDVSEILTIEDFKEAISNENVQLVDVRTRLEYKAGHIENAVNIDFFDRSHFNESFATFDREKPLYVYCRSGNRSQRAAKKLAKIGFKKIYDLHGGFKAWESSTVS